MSATWQLPPTVGTVTGVIGGREGGEGARGAPPPSQLEDASSGKRIDASRCLAWSARSAACCAARSWSALACSSAASRAAAIVATPSRAALAAASLASSIDFCKELASQLIDEFEYLPAHEEGAAHRLRLITAVAGIRAVDQATRERVAAAISCVSTRAATTRRSRTDLRHARTLPAAAVRATSLRRRCVARRPISR